MKGLWAGTFILLVNALADMRIKCTANFDECLAEVGITMKFSMPGKIRVAIAILLLGEGYAWGSLALPNKLAKADSAASAPLGFGIKEASTDSLQSFAQDFKSLSAEDLQDVYRAYLRSKPERVDQITLEFIKHDPHQAVGYLESLIELARESTFQSSWLVTHQQKVAAKVIDVALNKNDIAARLEALQELIRQRPANTAALILSFSQATASTIPARKILSSTIRNFEAVYVSQRMEVSWATLGLLALTTGLGRGNSSAQTSTSATSAQSAVGSSNPVSLGDPCGGGACTALYPESSFQGSEYNRQAGLNLIKASGVYAYAGTGAGITVAVFDTGIMATHSELSGKLVSGGYDYVSNSAGVNSDPNGHGTLVAGIIAAARNGVGMHGVAYDAQLLPMRIANAAGSVVATDAELANAVDRTLDNGTRIINNSWGTATPVTNVNRAWGDNYYPQFIAASRRSVAAGAVQVWSAGNASLSQPGYFSGLPYQYNELQEGWLAVVAVDPTGVKPMYSNQCGVAAAWCLAAPGGGDNSFTGIYSTFNNGGYAIASGTSMAAPHVSGAMAALKSRFPNLSYLQIRDRLLQTANRTGPYADTNIYGQGLLDLAAAASPVGNPMIPIGSNVAGLVVPQSQSSLTIPSSLYSSLGAQMPSHVLVVDSYQRAPFLVPIGQLVAASPARVAFHPDMLFEESLALNRSSSFTRAIKHVGGSLGLYGQTATARDAVARWYFGSPGQSDFLPALGFSAKIPTASNGNKYWGLAWQFEALTGNTVNLGAWSTVPFDSSVDTLPLERSDVHDSMLSPLQRGVALSKKWSLPEQWSLDTGAAIGEPAGVFSQFQSRGAFETQTQHTSVHWLHFGKTFYHEGAGSYHFQIGGQQTTLRTRETNSLIKLPHSIALLDLNLALRWQSPAETYSTQLEWTRTRAQDNPMMRLSLPVDVSESGDIIFRSIQGSMSQLFDQDHFFVRYKQKLGSKVQSHAIFGWGAQQIPQTFAGVGLRIELD